MTEELLVTDKDMIKPLNNYVVVRAVENLPISQGGIALPDSAKEDPSTGEVVAVGPGKFTHTGFLVSTKVKVGDIVYFPPHAGKPIKIKHKDYLVMVEDVIYGVL